MNLTETQIHQAIENLPENIHRAVNEFNWGNEIMKIGRAHQMQIDDIGIFRNETISIMLGLSPAGEYEQRLMSELNIPSSLATELVSEANDKIFSQLQRRAFRNEPDEEITSLSKREFENYLEPIEHDDLAGVMRNEGVELNTHDSEEPFVNSQLSDEVSNIFSGEDYPSSAPVIEQGEPQEIHVSGFGNSSQASPSSYLEPIEASDMKGVKVHQIDTSILKRNNQIPPENVFDQNEAPQDNGRDFGQKKSLDQSLDKHIMENPFMAKGDHINASPIGGEAIKEEKGFLQHLAE